MVSVFFQSLSHFPFHKIHAMRFRGGIARQSGLENLNIQQRLRNITSDSFFLLTFCIFFNTTISNGKKHHTFLLNWSCLITFLHTPLTALCLVISICPPPSLLILKYSAHYSLSHYYQCLGGRMTMTEVMCENVESWNLLSSIAELSVCEEMLLFLHLAKKFIPSRHNMCVVWDMYTKAHRGVCIIFTDTAINFNFENTVFLFLFQLQWKRRGRRKVNQSFPLTEMSFRLWLLWKMFLSFSDTIGMIYSIVMTHSPSCAIISQLYLLLLW